MTRCVQLADQEHSNESDRKEEEIFVYQKKKRSGPSPRLIVSGEQGSCSGTVDGLGRDTSV